MWGRVNAGSLELRDYIVGSGLEVASVDRIHDLIRLANQGELGKNEVKSLNSLLRSIARDVEKSALASSKTQTNFSNTIERLQLENEQKLERLRARTQAAVDREIRRERSIPLAKAEGEALADRFRQEIAQQTPVAEAQRAASINLGREARDFLNKGNIEAAEELTKRIPDETIKTTLQARIDQQKITASARTVERLRSAGVVDETTQQIFRNRASTTGRVIDEVGVKEAETTQNLFRNARTQQEKTTGQGLFGRILEGPTRGQAGRLVTTAVEKAQAGELAAGQTALDDAAALLKKIPGRRLARGGALGALALVLLPLLSRDREQKLPPALQARLLQQQQESDTQRLLAESVATQRGSEAQLNQARALLLGLQAKAMLGSGGPQLF